MDAIFGKHHRVQDRLFISGLVVLYQHFNRTILALNVAQFPDREPSYFRISIVCSRPYCPTSNLQILVLAELKNSAVEMRQLSRTQRPGGSFEAIPHSRN